MLQPTRAERKEQRQAKNGVPVAQTRISNESLPARRTEKHYALAQVYDYATEQLGKEA
jgi:hypothetical protein